MPNKNYMYNKRGTGEGGWGFKKKHYFHKEKSPPAAQRHGIHMELEVGMTW